MNGVKLANLNTDFPLTLGPSPRGAKVESLQLRFSERMNTYGKMLGLVLKLRS